MRPRFAIFILIVAAGVLAIIFWLRPSKTPPNVEPSQTIVQSSGIHTNLSGQSVGPMTTTDSLPTEGSSTNPEIAYKARILNTASQFVNEKNAPIEFYGLVIDQNSNALGGVRIKAEVRHWTMPNPTVALAGSKEISIERTTGADGRFEIHDVSGDGFGVLLFKDGYEAESEKNGFGGGTSGSYENPITFKMWSTNIHEKLIGGDKKFQIIPDGRAYFINLTDCTMNESGQGDLKVWINYKNQVQDSKLYDWSAGIEVVNGGLLEQGLGSPMYEAPTDGYVPAFQIDQKIKGYQGGETGSHQFFLRLRNGQIYGQMTIDLYAPFNEIPGLIRLSYAINPSGSRILR